MNTKSLLQAGALALALTATQLPAAVIFDTLPNPTKITTIRIDPGYVAQSFTVGATSYNLSSVVLSLGAKELHGGGSTFFVELLDATGAGHTPGAVLKTLTGNTDPTSAGQYTFTPSTTTVLAANTSYYIAAGTASGADIYRWDIADVASGTNPYGVAQHGGSGWSLIGNLTSFGLAMQVNGSLSPVPEPSEWAAVSVAMLGLVYVAKRRLAPARQ